MRRGVQGPEVSLEQVLEGRDRRAEAQRQWLARGGTLACMTLNMPGPRKRFPLADRAFRQGELLLEDQLKGSGFAVLERREMDRPAGLEYFLRVQGPPEQVKRCALALEERLPLGRLLDIDVFGQDGRQISRRQLGGPPRQCLLCPRPAAECARSRAHGIEAAADKAISLMEEYFDGQFARFCAAQAQRALLHEAACAPKPGLVDSRNSGAHLDMDQFSFLDSAAVLGEYFRQAAWQGIRFEGPPEALLARLRPLGLAAERQMLAATGGANTHKGAVFSLGILCGGAGMLYAQGAPLRPENLLELGGRIAAPAEGDFSRPGEDTAGRRLYRQTGARGARGQAAAGFPGARLALNALDQCLGRGFSWNAACCGALCALMAQTEDTNLLHRGGREGLAYVRRQAGDIWANLGSEEEFLGRMKALDRELIRRNLSPGGCADLLSAALFARFVSAWTGWE